MDNTEPNTEKRILEAAKKVFHIKGFDGARMQEIADEAGVNKSLVHYYFRNKENLFRSVFEEAFGTLLAKLNEIFFSDLPFLAKIDTFLTYYITFLNQHSYLPLFILNALNDKPEQIRAMMVKRQVSPERLLNGIREQVKEELHVEVDALHIFINILSLCVFPVLAKPIIRTIFGYSNEQLNQFYEERKVIVPEFILNAFKSYENQPGR